MGYLLSVSDACKIDLKDTGFLKALIEIKYFVRILLSNKYFSPGLKLIMMLICSIFSKMANSIGYLQGKSKHDGMISIHMQ